MERAGIVYTYLLNTQYGLLKKERVTLEMRCILETPRTVSPAKAERDGLFSRLVPRFPRLPRTCQPVTLERLDHVSATGGLPSIRYQYGNQQALWSQMLDQFLLLHETLKAYPLNQAEKSWIIVNAFLMRPQYHDHFNHPLGLA